MSPDPKEEGPIAFYSSLLSVTEVGLGSLLHAFHIPFRGYVLSLNQIFLLTRALIDAPKIKKNFIPFYISTIAATLKSLAPMGKKLTPMLAITAQGCLYNVGILLLGNTLIGRTIGASLSALWGFFQPLLIYYALFGQTLMDSFSFFNIEFTKGFFLIFVICFVGLKVLFSVCIVLFTSRLNPSHFERYSTFLSQISDKVKKGKGEQSHSLIRGVLKDLCRPLFLFSLFITGLFLYFANTSPTWLIWGILRPIGLSFVLGFIVRLFSAKKRKVNS